MVSMSFFMLLNILMITTLHSISDKLLASISFSSSGEFSCSFIWGWFLCLPILTPFLCICFYVLDRSAKALVQHFVRRCLEIALGNLFEAISNPQLVAPFGGCGCVQKEPGCASRLAFISIGLEQGSAKFQIL